MKELSANELESVGGQGIYELGYAIGYAAGEGVGYLNAAGRQLGGWIYETLHNN